MHQGPSPRSPGRALGTQGSLPQPRALSSPKRLVQLPAMQLSNVSPRALAPAEVMFSAGLSRALSERGPGCKARGTLHHPSGPAAASWL